MVLNLFISIGAGLFALVGVGAVFIGLLSEASDFRTRNLKVGSYAFTTAGLVLMVGSLSGLAGRDEIFAGLMLILFGTCTSWPAGKAADQGGAGPNQS